MTDKAIEAAARNWPEDANHENGNYSCTCIECGETFTGHKRRNQCRVCHAAQPSDYAELVEPSDAERADLPTNTAQYLEGLEANLEAAEARVAELEAELAFAYGEKDG